MGGVVKAISEDFNRAAFKSGAGKHHGSNRSENIRYFGGGGRIWAGNGNDEVGGAMGYAKIYKDYGRLNVYGAFGYLEANKYHSGDVNVYAATGFTRVRHSGWSGNTRIYGAHGGVEARKWGGRGDISFGGNTGKSDLRNYASGRGNVNFWGAGGYTYLERWGGQSGNVNFSGAAAYVRMVNTAKYGDINIRGAAGGFSAYREGYRGNVNAYAAARETVIHHNGTYGDINYYGAGDANVLTRSNHNGNINFRGAGGANVLRHTARYGNVNFYGAGVTNVITLNGRSGDVNFYGTGGANVITHTAAAGRVNFYGFGGANVITKTGWGGDVNFYGGGAANVITHKARYGNVNFYGAGGANVITRVGYRGDVRFYGAGMANIVTMVTTSYGYLSVRAAGIGNVITKKGWGTTNAWLGGRANVVTVIGDGHYELYAVGGANISTRTGDGFTRVSFLGTANFHTGVGDGDAEFYMGGTFNIVTKVGDGRVSAVMVGNGANNLTVTGDGDLEGVFLSAANVVTKVGDGDSAVVMAAFGNVFTNAGDGDLTSIQLGQGNVTTKVGNGDVYLLNVAVPLSAYFGAPSVPSANIFKQVGDGNVMGVMAAISAIAAGNVFTKVGDGDVAIAMASITRDSLNSFTGIGSQPMTLNVATQIGNGRTYALMFGGFNFFTKVGHGDYANGWDKWDKKKSDQMLNKGENTIADAVNGSMRKAADGMSPLLDNRKFNTIMGATGSGNVMVEANHKSALQHFDNTEAVADTIGKKTTKTIMAAVGGVGNAMVKVGDGDFYGLAFANPKGAGKYFQAATGVSDFMGPLTQTQAASQKMFEKNGNIIVHVGHGNTNAIAVGSNNIAVKVGDGHSKALMLGDNNVFVHVGNAGRTEQAVDIGGYRAFEGAQLVFGESNVVVNHGKSNDVIVAIDPNMLLSKERWKKIGEAMIPFSTSDNENETDIFGRKYSKKDDPSGYNDAKARNSFGMQGAFGIASLFSEGPGKILGDLKKQANVDAAGKIGEDNSILPDPYGNVIYGGEGSDVILAIGTNNVVLSDSWTGILDFNLEMLYDASGTNGTLSKLGGVADVFAKRTRGIGDIPVIGPLLGPVFSIAGIGASQTQVLKDLGNLTGLDGSANGEVEFDGSDLARVWTGAALGVPSFDFTTPQVWTNVVNMFQNIDKITSGASLTHGSEGYTSDLGHEFFGGFKSSATGFISVLGVPELISSLDKETDAYGNGTGRNVWQRFFDKDSSVGWGSMWKDPEAYWGGMGFLQNNGDLVAAIGMNNVLFTGEGGDMAFALGSYNSIALGDGRDISLTWGADNRVAGGNGNDFMLSVGQQNLQIGGNGNDLIAVLGEMNRAAGGGGDDMLIAIGKGNTVIAGGGDDFVIAIGQDNFVAGGGGDDLILAMGTKNIYNTGHGNDVVINVGFASQSFYGDGSDIAYARGKGDWLNGDAGDDILYGDAKGQDNALNGGKGNDTLYLGGDANQFSGGEGADTFVIRDAIKNVRTTDLSSDDRIVVKGVDMDELWFSNDGDDLLVEIDRWDRSLTTEKPDHVVGEARFKNWFSSSQSNLYFDLNERAGTSKELSNFKLNGLVQAMAGFTRADASGNFRDNLSNIQKSQLDGLLGGANTVARFNLAS